MLATTTLNAIRAYHPSPYHWGKLLKHLGKTKADDESLALATILRSNGLDDAIWCLRALGEEWRPAIIAFACDCAESVLPIRHENKTAAAAAAWVGAVAATWVAAAWMAAAGVADAVARVADAAEREKQVESFRAHFCEGGPHETK